MIDGYVPPPEMLFFDSSSFFGLSQWVKESPFVDSNNIKDMSALEPFPRCHHCPVFLEYVLQFTDDDNEDQAVEMYLWSKGD